MHRIWGHWPLEGESKFVIHQYINNGYHIVHSPLRKDENGVWRMDYEDMEKKLSEEKIHAAIFCSPHNPCGRVPCLQM